MSERPPTPAPVVPAATVILVRAATAPVEVFLVRRHGKSGFMADSYVFPGGKLDAADGGEPRVAALRELLEEAGVLLARGTDGADASPEAARSVRGALAGGTAFAEALRARGLELALDAARLACWGLWVTPSMEPRRFAAHFFVARLPVGQEAERDDRETTDALWIAPDEALARQGRGELKLPPPTIRTLEELARARDLDELFALAGAREPHVVPVMPRFHPAPPDGSFTLLWPWDPEYAAAPGEGTPIAADHPIARSAAGSRIVLGEGRWWSR